MHFLHKEAQEWIDNNPNPKMSELNSFANGNKDLKTMVRALLDNNLDMFIQEPNKNELTNFDKVDAIKHYSSYPDWFFVFCKKDLYTLDILYKMGQIDLANIILEKEINESSYIGNLVSHFIFNKNYSFEIKYLIKPSTIDELLFNIDPFVCDLKNVTLEEENLKSKVNYYRIQDFLTPRKNSMVNLKSEIFLSMNNLKNSYKEYSDMTEDEIFFSLIPNIIPIFGKYIFENTHIDYYIQSNILSFISDRIELFESQFAKKRSDKKKQIIENVFNGVSIASYFFLPQEAVKAATISMIGKISSNGFSLIDNMGIAKDMIELGKGIFGDFLNLEDADRLFKAFEESDFDNFQDFFIDQLKTEINYFLMQLFNQPIHLDESIYIEVYRQFFDRQILPNFNLLKENAEINLTIEEQIKNYSTDELKETYMIQCLFNADKNDFRQQLN